MRVGGIDEAGRGPVIGPMVIVGVEAEQEEIEKFEVKDSKKYSKSSRLKKFAQSFDFLKRIHVRVISPEEIDEYVFLGRLNLLEAKYFSSIISDMEAEKIYVDSFTNPAEIARRYLEGCEGKEVICEHEADSKYKIVSAASVIAKVLRDLYVEEIEKEIGMRIGSGYPSDPVTITFLHKWTKKYGTLPPYVRRSWKTVKKFIVKGKSLF